MSHAQPTRTPKRAHSPAGVTGTGTDRGRAYGLLVVHGDGRDNQTLVGPMANDPTACVWGNIHRSA